MGWRNRITPELITELKDNEIFVFGSNEGGKHFKGAAKTALIKFGAELYNPEGPMGIDKDGYGPTCYAIPTKNNTITRTLSINRISKYVNKFIEYAKDNPHLLFLVTPIGTGLAKIPCQNIAPLFKNAINIKNIYLPESFWKELIKD